MGGMTTVIWTDVMQFFLFIGSGFLALIWMVAMLPEGWSQFLTQAGAAGKFEIFRWVPPAGSEASFLSWMKDAEFTMWTALFAMPFQIWRPSAPTNSMRSGCFAAVRRAMRRRR
jgi:Na+/proline symporter